MKKLTGVTMFIASGVSAYASVHWISGIDAWFVFTSLFLWLLGAVIIFDSLTD